MFFHLSILILWICSLNLASSTNSTDCSTHTSCLQCIFSSCHWCVGEHQCTSNSSDPCPDKMIPPTHRDDYACPSIIRQLPSPSPYGDPSHILVPAGTYKSFQVEVNDIVEKFMNQSRFRCRVRNGGRVKIVNATLIGNVIYCENTKFAFLNSEVGEQFATFEVIWGNHSRPLENPGQLRVLIYTCSYGKRNTNCGDCLSTFIRFGCGWCLDTMQCTIDSQCSNGTGKFLFDYGSCSPFIVSFSPKFGPVEGGTNVTIRVSSLGKNFEDVASDITVAGEPCVAYRDLFKPNEEIVCLVNAPSNKTLHSGPVTLKLYKKIVIKSGLNFTFVDPVIKGIHPKHRPLSGNTELSIRGRHLDGGGQIEAFISEIPCKIVSIHSEVIKCIASASNKPLDGKVTVTFDRAVRSYDFFIYSDCMAHTSCVSCVTSSILCDWCVNGDRCKHHESSDCSSDELVLGVSVNNTGEFSQKGPSFCPKINSTIDGSSEILVPRNAKKSIKVKTEIKSTSVIQSKLECKVNIEGRWTWMNAQILDGVVYCDPVEFWYTQPGPNTTAGFDILWNHLNYLDNPTNVHVFIYECNGMAKTSNECLTLEEKYNCGWCSSTNSCEFKEQCK